MTYRPTVSSGTLNPSIPYHTSIRCLVPGLQRAGTARQYNSHKREKLKISTQINVKIVSLQLTLKSKLQYVQSTVLKDLETETEFHVLGPETMNALSRSI